MDQRAQDATTLALHQAIATLGETGLQAAAIHQGTMVVNTVAGIADVSTGTPVTPDTLFPIFSMSKGVTATIVHRLVERGVLACDEPLARWWPAFAAYGKEGITVRHALSHRTGLQTFKNLDRSEYPSLDATGRNLEEATPDYAPGASMGYHGMTFGTLLGKVIEGATGKPFAQVLHDEVTGPLGIPDLYCGVPDVPAVTNRIAALLPGGIPDSATGLVQMTDAERAPLAVTAAKRGKREFQTGCMPAGGIITNAASIVRMYGAMREPGLDGVRMLTPETIANATVPYFGADGRHIEWVGRMGLGYVIGGSAHLGCGVVIPSPWADSFGHTGLGGSLAMYCPSRDLAVALTKNALMPGRLECHTWDLVMRAITGALALPYEA